MSTELLSVPSIETHASVPPAVLKGFSSIEAALPWLGIALFAVLAWLNRAPGMLTRQDDARYLLLARAIRAGTYRDVMWPGAPWHHLYPPGYPALLAVWTAVGGERFDSLVVLQITLSVGTLWLTYDATRRVFPRRMALIALGVVVVSPRYLNWAGQVASEGALGVCFSLALWVAVAVPPGRNQTALIILSAILAPLMRSAGMALPLAVLVWWLSERRYRDCAWLVILAAPILGGLVIWTLSDPMPVAGSSYAGDIAVAARGGSSHLFTLATRVASNFGYYLTRALPVLLSAPSIEGTVVDNVLITLLLAAGLGVGIVRAWLRFRLAALLILIMAALLLIWPYQNARFVIPVLALVAPVLLHGLDGIAASMRSTRSRALAVGFGSLLIASGLLSTFRQIAKKRGCVHGLAVPANCVSADQASFFRATTFIRDSLPNSARILSAKSEPLYIYGGHPTTPLALWAYRDSTSFWSGLHETHTEFVLLGALQVAELGALAPRLAHQCELLTLVASFAPHTYLFHIEDGQMSAVRGPSKAPARRGAACRALEDYLRTAVMPG